MLKPTSYRFPRAAEPMVRYIRRTVLRPDKPPSLMPDGFGFYILRWDGYTCPMGFLKWSTTDDPYYRSHFTYLPKGITSKAVIAFAEAWDRFEYPMLAIDAVWGKKTIARKEVKSMKKGSHGKKPEKVPVKRGY